PDAGVPDPQPASQRTTSTTNASTAKRFITRHLPNSTLANQTRGPPAREPPPPPGAANATAPEHLTTRHLPRSEPANRTAAAPARGTSPGPEPQTTPARNSPSSGASRSRGRRGEGHHWRLHQDLAGHRERQHQAHPVPRPQRPGQILQHHVAL